MQKVVIDESANTMAVPGMKRAIQQYHDLNGNWKKNAVMESENTRSMIYQTKDNGP